MTFVSDVSVPMFASQLANCKGCEEGSPTRDIGTFAETQRLQIT